MDFKTSQKLYSPARINKYVNACAGNKAKTMQLYRSNVRLCQRFFGVLNLFEVILRNAINDHYIAYFADADWIVNQADVYKDITHIREFRNRIAHHEPICFDGSGNISTTFARKHYKLICDYIAYFGQRQEDVINWAERPDEILSKIDSLTK